MTLPTLPEPNMEVISGHREPFISYDSDQMKAYGQQCREAALEEAAQCLLEAGYRSNGITAYESLAERIRKLKNDK